MNEKKYKVLQVDMSARPPMSSDYPNPATSVFLQLHFYMITFSSVTTSVSVHNLSKEWHIIDNHSIQVRQVEVRRIGFQTSPVDTNEGSTTALTPVNEQGIVRKKCVKFQSRRENDQQSCDRLAKSPTARQDYFCDSEANDKLDDYHSLVI